MFEMFSAMNRVVVVPKEDNLFLHGVRNLDTFQESEPEPFGEAYGWNVVPVDSRTFSSLEEVVEASKQLDISNAEGFIVVYKDFNRVKIKAPQYVFFSLLQWRDKDGLNKRRMLEVVRTNE